MKKIIKHSFLFSLITIPIHTMENNRNNEIALIPDQSCFEQRINKSTFKLQIKRPLQPIIEPNNIKNTRKNSKIKSRIQKNETSASNLSATFMDDNGYSFGITEAEKGILRVQPSFPKEIIYNIIELYFNQYSEKNIKKIAFLNLNTTKANNNSELTEKK